ncbi:hypothetical protein FOZ63_011145 [Perkinsus olseni]|uniref:Lipoprotein n=1 Tax=Perkinsus olseni TaxID=32597 RepID=A0A7J6REF4_PEROL|nr:hypothetical protein FOZ62_022480 [Perkinsus olseni]KAF4719074.1 hypothetical protein FOZ63_011145 [Perkinsus olseni]
MTTSTIRPPHTTTLLIYISMTMISLFVGGCYSYGGLNVRRPEGSHKILEAEAAPRANEDSCYAEVFGVHVVFNRVGDGVYEGVTMKCGNRAKRMAGVEGYSVMKEYLLRVEDAPGCNDVYNKFHRGDQYASVPTSQIYQQLEASFEKIKRKCGSDDSA